MEIENLKFEKLSRDSVKTLVQWAEEEGWIPGPNDAGLFYNTDPDGFYGYFLGKEMIAAGAIVNYNDLYGFMGLFIVKPAFRSFGIGRKLWYQRRDLLLDRLNPGAAIGMDGVVAMQPFYEKGGFRIAFRDIRYQREGVVLKTGHQISEITYVDYQDILTYDKICFGVCRKQFMEPWVQQPGSKAFKYTSENGLMGFSVIRKAGSGYKIGPLFADNAAVAEELYKACLNAFPGKMIYLDIPEVNNAAMTLVQKYGAHYLFECARMYYGTPPDIDINKVFGITTFELG